MNDIEAKLQTLPERSGVYLMKNSDGQIIYVGKAKILKNRVRQYFQNHNHSAKVLKMIENIDDFEYIITDNEQEALILENNLIKEYMPKYNILLKDDKTYPFIKITLNEEFPRILMTRKVIRDGAKYFGPYCNNFNLKELLKLIEDVFGLRKCNKNISEDLSNSRPCLYNQIGKCSAPCSGSISKNDYSALVNKVISFLNGKNDDLINILQTKMKNAADNYDFETAAQWRDRIQSLALIDEKQKIVSAGGSDCDAVAMYSNNDTACVEIFFIRSGKVVGKEHYFLEHTDDVSASEVLSEFIKLYYENSSFIPPQILTQDVVEDKDIIEKWLGEIAGKSVKLVTPKIGDKLKLINMIASNAKKEHAERELKIMRDISFKNNALTGLQKLMNLDNPPMLIEAYDISNISGKNKVGAMVTFYNGKPCREKYRNFKIKYVSGQDDYACMEEVLSRRIEHGLSERDSNCDIENLKFYPFADIILVDGGIGHVKTAISVLERYGLDIPVFGIVKDGKHRTDGLTTDNSKINISKNSEPFMLLTQIQDEMHRRAISYHRQLREKNSLKTELMKIKGIGEKKAKLLLKQFKSVKRIKDASLEEISGVNGIDAVTAKNVYEYFNGF